MSNYIEFVHDQSDVSIGYTLEDMSSNDRYHKFEINTKAMFEYDGWYTYYRYEDDTKDVFIENGKAFLENPKSTTQYSKVPTEKIIYKR